MAEIPYSRFDIDAHFDPEPGVPGKSYVRHAALVAGLELFDAAAFGIAPAEAVAMDPQQRLMLEAGFEAFHNAGHTKQSLSGLAISGSPAFPLLC